MLWESCSGMVGSGHAVLRPGFSPPASPRVSLRHCGFSPRDRLLFIWCRMALSREKTKRPGGGKILAKNRLSQENSVRPPWTLLACSTPRVFPPWAFPALDFYLSRGFRRDGLFGGSMCGGPARCPAERVHPASNHRGWSGGGCVQPLPALHGHLASCLAAPVVAREMLEVSKSPMRVCGLRLCVPRPGDVGRAYVNPGVRLRALAPPPRVTLSLFQVVRKGLFLHHAQQH